jgi:hypothetical protein
MVVGYEDALADMQDNLWLKSVISSKIIEFD